MNAPRAVIADDELLLRQGLERLLSEGGIDVVATAGDAPDLIRKTRAHRPDVVITDVRMPPDMTDDGLRAAIAIRRALPGTGVLVLSQHLAERYALQLLGDDARGVGYLLKDRVADLDDFLAAVRTVAAGGTALDPDVVARMLGRRRIANPLEGLDHARARRAGTDGRGPLQPRDRRAPQRRRARGREARHPDLRQARAGPRPRRPPARAGRTGRAPRLKLAGASR